MQRSVVTPVIRQPSPFEEWDEPKLLAACMALGAPTVGTWTLTERRLTQSLPPIDGHAVDGLLRGIRSGGDPLGDLFCMLRSPAVRRGLGATYTPLPIVSAMVEWVRAIGSPERIVDPGCGSARFLLKSGRAFAGAELIGFEIDLVASIPARANLAAAGFADRSQVVLANYLEAELPRRKGHTLFIGNPPYARHHLLPNEWKD